MTQPNQSPPPRTGNLYAAVSHRLADQAKQRRNPTQDEANDSTTADMLRKVRSWATDPAYRASLTDPQHAQHAQMARWLHARGKLPADLAGKLNMPTSPQSTAPGGTYAA